MKKCMYAALSLALASCGNDPVTDGSFEGTERFVINGSVSSLEQTSPPKGKNAVAVQWLNYTRSGDFVTTQSAFLASAGFPAAFELKLFTDPPASVLNEVNESGPPTLGIGFVLAFEDVDGDGKLTTALGNSPAPGQDRIWGIAPEHLVLFVKGDAATTGQAAVFRDAAKLKPGFNVTRTSCSQDESVYDKFIVVDNEPMRIVPLSSNDAETACLNFF